MTGTTDPFDPTKDPDVQEGRSRVQGTAIVMLLPLKSGNLAVFGRDFQLHEILYDAPSMSDLKRISQELQAKLMSQRLRDAESRFLGEPDEKQMAREIRNGLRTQTNRPRRSNSQIEAMEL